MENKTLTFEEQKQMWINNQKEKGLKHRNIKFLSIEKSKCKKKKMAAKMVDYMINEKTYYWGREVRLRDNYQCAVCNTRKNLTAHHIFYKKKYPKLMLNLNNGITLCKDHHIELHELNGY